MKTKSLSYIVLAIVLSTLGCKTQSTPSSNDATATQSSAEAQDALFSQLSCKHNASNSICHNDRMIQTKPFSALKSAFTHACEEYDCEVDTLYYANETAITSDFNRTACDLDWINCENNYDYDPWEELECADMCIYNNQLAVPGTEYDPDSNEFLCNTTLGALKQPKVNLGYRCLARSISPVVPPERIPDYTERITEMRNTAPVTGGYICMKDQCICGDQIVPFATLCNDDTPVIQCHAESCPCADMTISDGMYCYKQQPYCGKTKLSKDATGFVCKNETLICQNTECHLGDHVVSKGTKITSDEPFSYRCDDASGCTVDGKSLAKSHSLYINDAETCGGTPKLDPNLVCQPTDERDNYNHPYYHWNCNADECITSGLTLHKNQELFIEGDIALCNSESSCQCGDITIPPNAGCQNGNAFCRSIHMDWETESPLLPSPGSGFACISLDELNRAFSWVCQNDTCLVHGKKISRGFSPDPDHANQYRCMIKEGCACGNRTLAQQDEIISILPLQRNAARCADDKIVCGNLPAPDEAVANSFYNEFTCVSLYSIITNTITYAWECTSDTCNYDAQRKATKGQFCNQNRCIDSSLTYDKIIDRNHNTDEWPDEEPHPKSASLEWMAELLTTDKTVCTAGNCPCGTGVCGRNSICIDGNCTCGYIDIEYSEDEDEDEEKRDLIRNYPDNPNAICIPSMRGSFVKRGSSKKTYDYDGGNWYDETPSKNVK